MAAKFEIYTDAKGEYRFRLEAGNGEIVATGESCPTEAGVRKGIGLWAVILTRSLMSIGGLGESK